jgi:hypothetical protein
MGIVATLEGYQRRGLCRRLTAAFMARLRERGCLLSHIQGIPYFYRQFGYEYAIPLEGGLRLEGRQVPDEDASEKDSGAPFSLRRATRKDIPDLARLYDEAAEDLAIHSRRGPEVWEYVLTHGIGSCTEAETWVLEQPAAGITGYFRLPRFHFNKELRLSEASRLSVDAARAVLRHLKKLMIERRDPGIQLNDVPRGALMRVARTLGAYDLGTYPWQIMIPDPAALLRALAPVWERRLAASPLAGLTRNVAINLYRRTLELGFSEGRLTGVTDRGPTGEAAIRIPPGAFTQLVLGWRPREALRAARPDFLVAPAEHLLIDTLFPERPGFLHQVY